MHAMQASARNMRCPACVRCMEVGGQPNSLSHRQVIHEEQDMQDIPLHVGA